MFILESGLLSSDGWNDRIKCHCFFLNVNKVVWRSPVVQTYILKRCRTAATQLRRPQSMWRRITLMNKDVHVYTLYLSILWMPMFPGRGHIVHNIFYLSLSLKGMPLVETSGSLIMADTWYGMNSPVFEVKTDNGEHAAETLDQCYLCKTHDYSMLLCVHVTDCIYESPGCVDIGA